MREKQATDDGILKSYNAGIHLKTRFTSFGQIRPVRFKFRNRIADGLLQAKL
jgi:hypothetical protein